MNSLIGRNARVGLQDNMFRITMGSDDSSCLKKSIDGRALFVNCKQYERKDGKIGDPWNTTSTNVAGFTVIRQGDDGKIMTPDGDSGSVIVQGFTFNNYVPMAITKSNTSDYGWRIEMFFNLNGFVQSGWGTDTPDPTSNIATYCITPGDNTTTSDGIYARAVNIRPCVYTDNLQDLTFHFYDGSGTASSTTSSIPFPTPG